MDHLLNLLSKAWEAVAAHLAAELLALGIVAGLGWLISQTPFSRRYKEAELHLKRAKALQEAERFEQAQAEIGRAIKILEDPRRSRILAEAYLRSGDIDMNLKQWKSAIQQYTLAKEEATAAKKASLLDVIYLRLGSACKMSGDLNQAYACIDQARILQERTQENPVLGETYALLGEIDRRRELLDTAISFYLRALPYQERIRDRRSQASTHVALGDLYDRKQMNKEFKEQYQAARELYDEIGDTSIAQMLAQKIN
jgi:tetratricopeptide (TPR) repeat protein